ncbi:Class III cytochrome C family protein [Reichenbachiella faecimaris]|uniref:Class III cytochrome C family protein n=1 Tax=Reichenbachiella faecimaris TaxID=692418 RepID=A0A1W2G984_REIFA|nr:c-type cytochrome [Reichenbachiella faecimaris]SMD33151.1 Class III cytochrome C family protein [Reichenbachiella faecimaris]
MSKKYSLHSRAGFLSTKTVLFLSLIFSVLFTQNTAVAQDDGIPTDEATISAGEKLFKANCTVCHAVNDKVIGPALRDVHKRRNLAWIQAFVKNSQKVIQSGDDYAVNLYNEYNKTEMTAFDFEDAEIASIVGYLKAESAKEIVVATEETTTTGGDEVASQEPSQFVNIVMIVLLVVLVLILAVLGMIITMLKKYLSQKDDLSEEDREIAEQTFDVGALVKSNAFLGLAAFVFTAIIMKSAIDGIFTIGVQQGYQPDQPIAFSHKIHAGDYKIDCNYCHTGVRKSKNANIPSPNICMNCHSSIKTESPEIQKIYAAIENNEPIEWVRIHNLPDLAYFNHSQHVKVGEIECQTCHGPIEEMDKVSQYAPLTMGWCINCHRETDVNTKGNDYYNKLVAKHAEHSKESMKVEDIGGLECSKCHY